MALYPKAITEYLALSGIPRGPYSNVYIVDPVNGSDSNTGATFKAPLKSVEAAYALCTTNQHDVVLFLGMASADSPTAAIDWAKSYTHLVGMSGNLPGTGQRCRLTGTAALDLNYIVDFQGNGCIVKNIQFYQGNDAAEDSGAAIVSGARNHFENCFFAGMGHATAAARAGSYSLKITGEENCFERCTIGLATQCRGAANTELWLTGECARNQFRDCEFVSWSVDTTKMLVSIDASAVPYTTTFWNCVFSNLNSNGGASGNKLADVITDAATPMHINQLHNCTMFGCTGWSTPVTYTFAAQGQPHNTGGVAIVPAH